jgi:hypothetical protein
MRMNHRRGVVWSGGWSCEMMRMKSHSLCCVVLCFLADDARPRSAGQRPQPGAVRSQAGLL